MKARNVMPKDILQYSWNIWVMYFMQLEPESKQMEQFFYLIKRILNQKQ